MPRKRIPPNNKKRRVIAPEALDPAVIDNLRGARYCGSPHHKSKPGDYGFIPPAAALPGKDLCDGEGLPAIKLREAIRLFRSGIRRGMVSGYLNHHGLPVRVWSVDEHGHAYEAKPGDDGRRYHGFRLVKDESTARYIRQEWQRREDPSDA